MTPEDRKIIQAYAAGDRALQGQAIEIHRNTIRTRGLMRGDPFFDFMSEVDNQCPDYLARARARIQVVETRLS